jgi:EpsI family protein
VFQSLSARVLTIVLLAQGGLFYGAANRTEYVPDTKPLAAFPAALGDWKMVKEGYVDEQTQAVLRADDTLTRVYAADGNIGASLFIAFFKTQRTGKAPHSPKNCLPGSGWEPENVGTLSLQLPNQPDPIQVNKYVVVKGEYRSVVLYWYQSRDRIVASEYAAKVWMVADSIRYNRSDTALVRVVVPVVGGDEEAAVNSASKFVQSMFPSLRAHLPA